MWQLPLKREHRKQISSTIADITNSSKGDRFAGASQAAAFLESFIDKDTKWVHIDIAGPSVASGIATGFSTKTLLNYLINEDKLINVKEKDEITRI